MSAATGLHPPYDHRAVSRQEADPLQRDEEGKVVAQPTATMPAASLAVPGKTGLATP